MDAADAAVLAEDIQDKGALTSLDITRNCISDAELGNIQHVCAEKNIVVYDMPQEQEQEDY